MPADTIMDDVQQLDRPSSQEEEFDKLQRTSSYDNEETPLSTKAFVEEWFKKIDKAEAKYRMDFERMSDNMNFVCGLQWNGQRDIQYDKYVANWTIRAVNQGVATLYARNPRVEARRNPHRMNFQMWDGKVESLQQISAIMMMGQKFGLPIPPDIQATWQDFQQGALQERLIDKVAETLENLCQYWLDNQTPSFKLQMKQLVRRVNVCGVGYIKVSFCREGAYDSGYNELYQSETRLSMTDRLHMAMQLMEKVKEDKITETSADLERVKMLINSIQTHPLDTENTRLKEHIVFDFPRATSILPDPNTRTLKGFVGAHWIAEKLFYPLEYVNAIFDAEIDPDKEMKFYDTKNRPDEGNTPEGSDAQKEKKNVCLYVIHDLDSKSCFTLCRGHKDFLCEPEAVTPCPRDFWNIFPVTFNDVEVEEGCVATIFPPSLVDLIKPSQKEWNRIREALRRHRRANGPKYVYAEGTIGEDDLDRLANAEDQDFVPLRGIPPGSDPTKCIAPLNSVDIKNELYDAEPLREDALLTSGQQEANQGPPQPNITATGVNVAEQSRMGVAASDIDGLDDALTAAVSCSGELSLMEASRETVTRVVGRGAVWPEMNRQEFLDNVDVRVIAASSGKPNQAVELNKWQTIVQMLLQFGAAPQPVIRETIERFDEKGTLKPEEFFPIQGPPMMGGPQQQQPQQAPQRPQGQKAPPKGQPKQPQRPPTQGRAY